MPFNLIYLSLQSDLQVTEESENSSRLLNGLVMKKLTKTNSSVGKYKGVTRHVELLENSTNLFLPNVTVEDSGIYSCFLSAPLGHQNQEGDVHLNVYGECPILLPLAPYKWSIQDESAQTNNLTLFFLDESTVEKLEFNNDDTIYIVALTVLVMALLIMFISYVSIKLCAFCFKYIYVELQLKVIYQRHVYHRFVWGIYLKTIRSP